MTTQRIHFMFKSLQLLFLCFFCICYAKGCLNFSLYLGWLEKHQRRSHNAHIQQMDYCILDKYFLQCPERNKFCRAEKYPQNEEIKWCRSLKIKSEIFKEYLKGIDPWKSGVLQEMILARTQKPQTKVKDYRILKGLHLREKKLRQSVLEISFFLK